MNLQSEILTLKSGYGNKVMSATRTYSFIGLDGVDNSVPKCLIRKKVEYSLCYRSSYSYTTQRPSKFIYKTYASWAASIS